MDQGPLVSIVTPCLNAAQYIGRTLESVFSQDYPNIELLVMDGGSTDGTVEILKGLGGRVHYVSAPDGGAADAVNRGFRRARGSIFAWLSADDTYLPGAVSAAVRQFMAMPNASVVYGEGMWIDADGRIIGRYPTLSPYDARNWQRECFVCQPATFIKSAAFDAVGMLNTKLHSAFDYDLWIRLSQRHSFVAIPQTLAASRMHPANKSLGKRQLAFKEAMATLRHHFGYIPVNWIYGYLMFLRDGRDQFFEPLRHSAATYLASLPVGSYYNYRHPVRFWSEWLSRILKRGWLQSR
jgi:glycosyltransferase involved in cell wall biosynthesis